MLQSRDEAGSPDSLWVMDITPLMPQLITAVATLGGVVLTLLITGRRERERVDQMIAFEREKILADDRRELFVRTAHALQRMRELLKVWVDTGDRANVWLDDVTQQADVLFLLETELRLLALKLAKEVQEATRMARKVRDLAVVPATKEARSDLLFEYEELTRNAMRSMRQMLGSEDFATDLGN